MAACLGPFPQPVWGPEAQGSQGRAPAPWHQHWYIHVTVPSVLPFHQLLTHWAQIAPAPLQSLVYAELGQNSSSDPLPAASETKVKQPPYTG